MTPHQESLPFHVCICGKPDCKIPYGYCHCGCGILSPIATKTQSDAGWIKGFPKKYIVGHCRFQRPIPEKAKPFKIDGVYCRLIPLTKGQHAIVWESDYEWLMQWKWYAVWNKYTRSFYAYRKENGRHIGMHCQILGLSIGDKREGDHEKSGETLDNRRSNLRITDRNGNMRNRRINRNNKSGFKGVHLHRPNGTWKSEIRVNGKKISLGYYKEPEQAHEAYKKAATMYFGSFARFK